MEQFIVPQFIDVEDKILGPITTRQFVLMIIGGLLLVVAYKLFDLALFILSFIFVGGTVALFGFYKVNGRPFHLFLMAFFQLGSKPRLRVWNKYDDAAMSDGEGETAHAPPPPPRARISRTRLAELALQLDTGGVFEGEEFEGNKLQTTNPK